MTRVPDFGTSFLVSESGTGFWYIYHNGHNGGWNHRQYSFAYPQRDGQAELASVADNMPRWFARPYTSPNSLYRRVGIPVHYLLSVTSTYVVVFTAVILRRRLMAGST